jgi:hypothetical protein
VQGAVQAVDRGRRRDVGPEPVHDLIAVQPVLREFTAAFAYKQYEVAYHPGALKYFKEQNLAPRSLD